MCLNITIEDMNWLWHMRLHVNFDSLSELAKKNMVSGLSHISKPKKTCEVYTLGKTHRNPFPLNKS